MKRVGSTMLAVVLLASILGANASAAQAVQAMSVPTMSSTWCGYRVSGFDSRVRVSFRSKTTVTVSFCYETLKNGKSVLRGYRVRASSPKIVGAKVALSVGNTADLSNPSWRPRNVVLGKWVKVPEAVCSGVCVATTDIRIYTTGWRKPTIYKTTGV